MHLFKNYRAELRSRGNPSTLCTERTGYYSIYERQGRAFVHIGRYEISGRVTLAKILDAVRADPYTDMQEG